MYRLRTYFFHFEFTYLSKRNSNLPNSARNNEILRENIHSVAKKDRNEDIEVANVAVT